VAGAGGIVEKVFMFHRTNAEVPTSDLDVNMEEEMAKVRPYCPCEEMDAEDNLFLLYTSGSTGTLLLACSWLLVSLCLSLLNSLELS